MTLRKSGNRYIGELSDLTTKVGQYRSEERFLCPFCPELTGTPDKHGKFYYNTVFQVGTCFRCGTIIVDKSLRSYELIKQQLNSIPESVRYHNQILNLGEWTFRPSSSREHFEYMTERRGISQKVVDRFNVLACDSPRKSIVFINKLIEIDGRHMTDYIQNRLLKPKGRMKYINLPDEIKPLSWAQHVNTHSVAIVEGFISGLSVYQHMDGAISPLVLCGKTISDFQMKQLKELCSQKDIRIIYVITDGGFFENGMKIARVVERELYGQTIFVTKLPARSDPNEMSPGQLMTGNQFKEILEKYSWSYTRLNEATIRRTANSDPGADGKSQDTYRPGLASSLNGGAVSNPGIANASSSK